MKLDMQTIAGIITRGDRILDELRRANTTQTIGQLKRIAEDPHQTAKLLNDLDALENHLRVLKLVEFDVANAK